MFLIFLIICVIGFCVSSVHERIVPGVLFPFSGVGQKSIQSALRYKSLNKHTSLGHCLRSIGSIPEGVDATREAVQSQLERMYADYITRFTGMMVGEPDHFSIDKCIYDKIKHKLEYIQAGDDPFVPLARCSDEYCQSVRGVKEKKNMDVSF